MVRSLYSGVAGMMAQQTRMDVIGNNISNVGTYGYKSSRATFRDVYYQTKSGATAAGSNSGGTNATQIGYGSKLSSVDVNHSQSIMTSTGYTMDCAITGEGYFQVMDSDGNIFYTKAGMFDIDAEGNLVDANGNFVLGSKGYPNSLANSAPGSDKISISLPYETATVSSASTSINGNKVSISSSNTNNSGNVGITFATTTALPVGQKAEATVTSNSIVIKLNASETFNSLEELNRVVNDAITKANGNVAHDAGDFTISLDDASAFSNGGIKGSEIVGTNFGVNLGSVTLPAPFSSYCSVKSVGNKFSGDTVNADMSFALDANNNLTITVGDYTATLTAEQIETSGTVMLKKNGSELDSFTITYPSYSTITSNNLQNQQPVSAVMTPTEDSKDLGLGSSTFALTGGTSGGEQTAANLTGIAVGQNGVITGIHPSLGQIELGRIDLATFVNPAGLTQEGDTYFSVSANSGTPLLSIAGENGTGAIAAGTLEASNVDLSQEFSDMITTQRAFQACSRIITVSDTMLEELINLKR